MSNLRETAEKFFHACESSKGWAACQEFCHPDARFDGQAAALAEFSTVEGYTDWMAGIKGPMPDARYELLAIAVDEERAIALGHGVWEGTHTGDGGPVPPTGKSVATEFTHVIRFEGDKIRSVTKVWNDGFAFAQLGWA